MNGVLEFSDLEEKKFAEVRNSILNEARLLYGDLTYANIKINDLPDLALYNPDWEKHVFGYGVYIFFNQGLPVYMGVADKNFKHRFQSHRAFDGRPEWAYNKLARLVAEKLLCNADLAMNKDCFYEKVIPRFEKLEVLRINFLGTGKLKKDLVRLESILKYAFKDTAWNGKNYVSGYSSESTLKSLMGK